MIVFPSHIFAVDAEVETGQSGGNENVGQVLSDAFAIAERNAAMNATTKNMSSKTRKQTPEEYDKLQNIIAGCKISPIFAEYINMYQNKLFRYQKELLHKVLSYDSACYLPTGAGKTFVATMLIARMTLLHPEKCVIFVVNRVALANQQAAVIERQLKTTVHSVTGGSRKFANVKLVKKYCKVNPHTILCVIDSIFERWISKDASFLKDHISLIVFDEVHHARGGPYKNIFDSVHTFAPRKHMFNMNTEGVKLYEELQYHLQMEKESETDSSLLDPYLGNNGDIGDKVSNLKNNSGNTDNDVPLELASLLLRPLDDLQLPLLCGLTASPITRFTKMEEFLQEFLKVTKCRLVQVSEELGSLRQQVKIPTMISLAFYSSQDQLLLHKYLSVQLKDISQFLWDFEEIMQRIGVSHKATVKVNKNNIKPTSAQNLSKGVIISSKNSIRSKIQRVPIMSVMFSQECENCKAMFLTERSSMRENIAFFVDALQKKFTHEDSSYVMTNNRFLKRYNADDLIDEDLLLGKTLGEDKEILIEELFRLLVSSNTERSIESVCFFLSHLIYLLEGVSEAMHQLESVSIGNCFQSLYSHFNLKYIDESLKTCTSFGEEFSGITIFAHPFELFILPIINKLKQLPVDYFSRGLCSVKVSADKDAVKDEDFDETTDDVQKIQLIKLENAERDVTFEEFVTDCPQGTREQQADLMEQGIFDGKYHFSSQECSTRMYLLFRILEESVGLQNSQAENGSFDGAINANNQNSQSKGIIFVDTKTTAINIFKGLYNFDPEHRIFDFWQPAILCGQNRSKNVSGMTKKIQNDTVGKFRRSEYKLLIATAVAEEGLDIPTCNLVIRYDACVSLRDVLQTRGRARHSHSLFILLTNLGFAESRMHSILTAVRKQNTLVTLEVQSQRDRCLSEGFGGDTSCQESTEEDDDEDALMSKMWKRSPEGALAQIQNAYGVRVFSLEKNVLVKKHNGSDVFFDPRHSVASLSDGDGHTFDTPNITHLVTFLVSMPLLESQKNNGQHPSATVLPFSGSAQGTRNKARQAAMQELCQKIASRGYFEKENLNTFAAQHFDCEGLDDSLDICEELNPRTALAPPAFIVGKNLVYCSRFTLSAEEIKKMFPNCTSIMNTTVRRQQVAANSLTTTASENDVWSRLAVPVSFLLRRELRRLKVGQPVVALLRDGGTSGVTSTNEAETQQQSDRTFIRVSLTLNKNSAAEEKPGAEVVTFLDSFKKKIKKEQTVNNSSAITRAEKILGMRAKHLKDNTTSENMDLKVENTSENESGSFTYKNTKVIELDDTKYSLEVTSEEPNGVEKASLTILRYFGVDILDGVPENELIPKLIRCSRLDVG